MKKSRIEPRKHIRVRPKQKHKIASPKTQDCARDPKGSTTEYDDTMEESLQLRYESWLLTRDADRICR